MTNDTDILSHPIFAGLSLEARQVIADNAAASVITVVNPGRPGSARGWVEGFIHLAESKMPVVGDAVRVVSRHDHELHAGKYRVVESPWVARRNGRHANTYDSALYKDTFRVEATGDDGKMLDVFDVDVWLEAGK